MPSSFIDLAQHRLRYRLVVWRYHENFSTIAVICHSLSSNFTASTPGSNEYNHHNAIIHLKLPSYLSGCNGLIDVYNDCLCTYTIYLGYVPPRYYCCILFSFIDHVALSPLYWSNSFIHTVLKGLSAKYQPFRYQTEAQLILSCWRRMGPCIPWGQFAVFPSRFASRDEWRHLSISFDKWGYQSGLVMFKVYQQMAEAYLVIAF